jgi:hypothetical protein
MTGFDRLPSRDEVLASGIPAGFIAYHRQQAAAARAHAIGAFLAAAVHPILHAWRRREDADSSCGGTTRVA